MGPGIELDFDAADFHGDGYAHHPFSGGRGGDNYDWQTDENVVSGSFQWASNAATFAKVTAAQNAQAFVTVNYGSGTPQEAAAWVAYLNGGTSAALSLGTDSKSRNWKTVGYWASIRAAAPLGTDDGYNFLRISHAAPFGFLYWEIGNECYGNWETDLHGQAGSRLTGSQWDAVTYANAFATSRSRCWRWTRRSTSGRWARRGGFVSRHAHGDKPCDTCDAHGVDARAAFQFAHARGDAWFFHRPPLPAKPVV